MELQGSVAEWGSEAEVSAALALLPVPQPVTPAALVTLVAALREDLPRLPQRAVAPLCARVHDATRQLLSSLDLSDKHGEMALKQVTACAEVRGPHIPSGCLPHSEALLAHFCL